ncbi:MAG: hypothetical protein ACI89U_000837, partial [Gammaproteobacteria bacterium]
LLLLSKARCHLMTNDILSSAVFSVFQSCRLLVNRAF